MALLNLNKTTIPESIQTLPCDERGYPIPWFVHRDSNGEPDFRVAATYKIDQAVANNLCWVCGGQLQFTKAFVIGPLGVVNRVSLDPPSHSSCAVFVATTGLSKPVKRKKSDRGPDVVAVWIARGCRVIAADRGVVFGLREPQEVLWYCAGKPAPRSEVLRAMSEALRPALDEARPNDVAMDLLMRQIDRAGAYLPPRTQGGDHASAGPDASVPAGTVETPRQG
jgi:hypothetical protein